MFVKLSLPKNISKELSNILPESTPKFSIPAPNSHHITVLYLGRPGKIKLKTIVDKIRGICNNQPRLSSKLGGVGYFRLLDNSIVTYASVNCPGLDLLRADLFRIVNPIFPVPNSYGFNAHVTLCKGPAPPDIIYQLPDIPWTFDGLKVDFGDDKIESFLFNKHLS